MNGIMLTPNSDSGLLLQERTEVTFCTAEYQYSGTAAILGLFLEDYLLLSLVFICKS